METTPASAPPAPAAPPSMGPPPQVYTGPPPPAAGPAAAAPPASGPGLEESFKKAVSNPIPLLFGIIVVTGICYAIAYYQQAIRVNKVFVKQVENKMDELDIKYADIVSKMNKPQDEQQSFDGQFYY